MKKRIITTPFVIYVTCILVIVAMYLAGVMINCKCSETLKNISIGCFSSLFVALLIDLGNTKKKNEEDRLVFEALSENLRELCDSFPMEIYTELVDRNDDYIEEKKTYSEWCKILLLCQEDISTEEHKKKLEIALDSVSRIQEESKKLSKNARMMASNFFISENKIIEKCEAIIQSCIKVDNCRRSERYDECYKELVGDFMKNICELFPDKKAEYTQKFNAETYIS